MTAKKKSPVAIKVGKLIREGKSRSQAYAIANSMKKEGRLGPRGGYVRKPRKK